MKQFIIVAAAGFVVFQMLLVLAIMAAAARPIPQFEQEPRKTPDVQKEREEDLELVA
jgi:hypothetical protein